jgi:hypothetical protein
VGGSPGLAVLLADILVPAADILVPAEAVVPEDAVVGAGVDVDPLGLRDVLQVLVEVFAEVELRELLIDAADFLEDAAELFQLLLLLLPG